LWIVFVLAGVFLLQLPYLATGVYWQVIEQAPFDQAFSAARSQEVLTTYKSGSFADLLNVNAWQGFTRKWSWFYHYGRLYNVFGLTLLGYGLARLSFFSEQERQGRRNLVLLIICIALVVVLELLRDRALASFSFEYARDFPASAYSTVINNLYTFITILLALLLFRLALLKKLLLSLAPAGRMSLTVYLGQSLICIPLYYGFGLSGWQWLNSETSLLIGVVMWALLMLVCHHWMARYRYGPAEWFWRACTLRDFTLGLRRD
jgi:uncharacterized protein